ncbi:DUF6502 family protein [uncultured Roseobacter sp.]|uniref:DUF6502 family protein n=1 Tax=uncultured Roseobacter sp. TaxID=114847 RepID=UPI00261A566F|nr:DUF6502 family protein [uncultured Roseobacter sp.]
MWSLLEDDNLSEEPARLLKKTLSVLLRPVAKLMISHGFSIQDAVELMKAAMVQDVLSNGAATDSHIALKTGVHRKDVRRLRASNPESAGNIARVSPIAIVQTHWAFTPPFGSDTGVPGLLTRQGEQGFDALVRSSKVDLPPATVLAEMKTQRLVEEKPDRKLELLTTTYVPKFQTQTLAALEATLSDHLRVAVENATDRLESRRHFDQVLRYSHLSDKSINILEDAARKRAREFLDELNSLAHELQQQDDRAEEPARGRFVTGIFIAPTADPPKED